MREKGQNEVAKTLETPVFSRGIEILTEKIEILRKDNYEKPLAPIMLNDAFVSVFDEDFYVCYELGSGCKHKCSFCTLRQAFGNDFRPRDLKIVQEDLYHLSSKWSKLKLIDDDIFQSYNNLNCLDLSGFKEVVVETRIENLSENFFRLCKNKGITHIITGVESFSYNVLNRLNKSPKKDWINHITKAITYCQKYQIMLRPVVMLNPPESSEENLYSIVQHTKSFTPENQVELLLSMYTPHPGMPCPSGILLSNNLSLFDHLHLVYEQIVSQTKSRKFNPTIRFSSTFIDEYSAFFPKYC